jgi:phenylalanyl-tRNA synthetase beta chain
MNIKITYNWLLDYLDTDADPYEIQKYLSLCGPSVEHVIKIKDDYVLDIEITSNRIDNASVLGIAQECQAILPQFGKKASLKINPLIDNKFQNKTVKELGEKLIVKINEDDICSRFTAIIISDLKIQKSNPLIASRLEMCDIKSINSAVDISNYLMITFGQPTHFFDYDKIAGHKMVMRYASKGEEIFLLDDKKYKLQDGDIVMEDGDGKLFDLCGIMGGGTSCIDQNTKNILVFVQTYNKQKIRKTSMTLGIRTVAATYFEKGLDEERVEATTVEAISLLSKIGGKVNSDILDIYPNPYKNKIIKVPIEFINKKIGINIDSKKIISILENLGFLIKNEDVNLEISVPSFRKNDIEIKEDIVEEVARIYGYNNLPGNIPSIVLSEDEALHDKKYLIENKLKYFLKHLGLNEVFNYSMISETQIANLGLDVSSHLKIKNTISKDIEFMRMSLFPSLIKNISDNQGKKENLSFFEISNTYLKKENDIPYENKFLGIISNTDYYELLSIITAIFREFNIDKYSFKKSTIEYLENNYQAELIVNNIPLGFIGKVALKYQVKNNLKKSTYLCSINMEEFVKLVNFVPKYQTPNQFAIIKYDLTIEDRGGFYYQELLSKISSPLLQKVEVLNLYQGKINLRFYFSSSEKNLTEIEVKEEIQKIQTVIK